MTASAGVGRDTNLPLPVPWSQGGDGDAPTAQVFVAYAKRCFQLGASGFVSKEEPIGHVQEAIRCVMQGYGYVSERLTDAVMREAAQTPRT